MNYFTVLHQITIKQHNDRLWEVVRAGLVKDISRRNRPARSVRPMVFLIRQTPDARHVLRELFLSRSAPRKAAPILKWLAAVLILTLLLSSGWFTTAAQAQIIQLGCTNGVGSVTDLIDAIKSANLSSNEDTLILSQDCVYTLSSRFDSTLNGLPVIQNDLIIEGNGATIRRRVAKTATFRLFEVANGVHLTLRNLTLQSGRLTGERGGAILAGFGTPLTLEKVTFLGNSALEGGAIFAVGPVTARDSAFIGNAASEEGGGLLTVAPLTLAHTTFVNNKAARGGGLYGISQVSVTGGRFENNQALSDDGGGIFMENSDITLKGTELLSNTAARSGGGLYSSGHVSVTGGRLEGNQALSENGGGILVENNDITLVDTEIIGNAANISGGGIGTVDEVSLTMVGGQIVNNIARSDGGGVDVQGTLNLSGTIVMGNTVQDNGGGGVFATQAITITNSHFEQNNAFNRAEGGGVLSLGNTFIDHTTFINNTARAGGGIEVKGATLTIHDSQFLENKTALNGGAVSANSAVTINNSVFERNEGVKGGALQSFSAATIHRSRFSGNIAQKDGGGVFSISGRNVTTVTESVFESNQALEGDGGGLFAQGETTVTGSRFESNQALNQGGGIFADEINLSHSTLFKNRAAVGSGLYLISLFSAEPSLLAIVDGPNVVNNLWIDNAVSGDDQRGAVITVDIFSKGKEILNQPKKILRQSIVSIQNNTIAGLAPAQASGIFVNNGQIARIQNNIITNYEFGLSLSQTGVLTAEHNLYFNNTTNEVGDITSRNNREADPRFVDPANGDFHLRSDSPARDSGLDVGVTVDFDGAARPFGKGFDIGAFEFVATPPDGGDPPSPDPGKDFTVYLPLVLK